MDEKIRRSRKQERDGAKRYGGTVNSQSGAGDIRKNDVRTPTESIEFKSTLAASYSLKRDDLATAWQYAIVDSRSMIFGIEFANRFQRVVPAAPRRYIVMPEDDYLGMKEHVADLEATLAAEETPLFPDDGVDLWS